MMLRSLHPIILIILFCDLRFIVSTTAMLMNNVATIERKHPEEASFVEYFKDHEVSEKQARENLRGLKENDFATPAYCKACSLEHRKYCISENLLKDHCCCNQSHNKGEFNDLRHLY
ncbi:CLUMA_CG016247, isoform A [Clunio marinus]|uniref:CLUMA_CG016247, isoform A n=1 Tax=Clunio marinus TaxID=568069 RepID=A0A1J1IS65_9DIPT|nr:CLUMA_CG016247, isoform A [Clunio marinus]